MEGPTWFSWWGDADWVVRGVFMVLVGMSLASWTAIFYKARQFARLLRAERSLARHLDSAAAGGGPYPPLDGHSVPSRALFALHSSSIPAAALEGRIGHALRETRVELESGLSLLATIGNTAPFIGLLGTVWGIMHALQGLSAETALSLAMVGGPVAEALVATAAGLFAAIPAVMGYNYLLRQLGRLMMALEGNARRLAAQPSGLRLVEAR